MTRTEDQTARSFIQRQFEPQGAKHGHSTRLPPVLQV